MQVYLVLFSTGEQTMRTLISSLAVLSLIAIGPAHAFKRTTVGEAVKDFAVETIDGRTLRLSESLGQKATLILFWAAWSPRSAEALNDYQKLYAAHGPDDLQVIAVNVEHQEWEPDERAKIADFTDKQQLAFPVALDEELAVFDDYGVVAVPSTVLADRDGAIVGLLEGYAYTTRHDFRDRILEQLGGLQRPPAEPEAVAQYRPKGKAARFYQMGELFLRKKMTGRAAKAFAKATEEDPEYAAAHLRWAEALEADGRDDEAAEIRARAIALGGEQAGDTAPSQVTAAPATGDGATGAGNNTAQK
jgi:peroxiredoxin